MSRGSKYTDADRRKAVQEYSLCGSLAEVGESCGIPRKTLGDWFGSKWWNQLTEGEYTEAKDPENGSE